MALPIVNERAVPGCFPPGVPALPLGGVPPGRIMTSTASPPPDARPLAIPAGVVPPTQVYPPSGMNGNG